MTGLKVRDAIAAKMREAAERQAAKPKPDGQTIANGGAAALPSALQVKPTKGDTKQDGTP